MSTVMKKSFDNPDEVRAPDKAKVSVCDLEGVAAAKLVLQPGWSWETCVKPMVGGENCQANTSELFYPVKWQCNTMTAQNRFLGLVTFMLLNPVIMVG